MIKFNQEETLSIEEAAERTKKTPATIRRWINAGYRGIKLEALPHGSELRTSIEALQRFFEQIATMRQHSTSPAPVRDSRDVAATRERIRSKHKV